MPKIISLEEVETNRWVAKYRGNYGTYTIRLTVTADGRTADFHCTCPSDYYPCKHINMILDAIPKQIAKQEGVAKSGRANVLSPAKLLAKVPEKELRAFVVAQVAKNASLRKAVLLAFAHKSTSVANPYSQVIREGLGQVDFDFEDDDGWYHREGGIPLDILDEMFERAAANVENGKFDEAVLIAKACLEEYAEWMDGNDHDVNEHIDYDYAERPFLILREVAEKGGCDDASLYDYCKAKSQDALFDTAETQDYLQDLMLVLAIRANRRDFIAVQEKLLANVPKSQPDQIERILSREIEFYRGIGEHGHANAVLQANVQIESFRKNVVDDLIAAHKYSEAKALMDRYPPEQTWRGSEWDKRRLAIARAECDTPKICEYAWRFIEKGFDCEYYRIYKSAFPESKWPAERERLLRHYAQKRNGYRNLPGENDSANVLVEENLAERLLCLLEKNPSPQSVQHYHKHVAALFPERTLALFKKAVDTYAAAYTGDRYYEDIAKWLETIRKLPGGAAVCDAMLADYRLTYKRRPAMMRILAEKFGK